MTETLFLVLWLLLDNAELIAYACLYGVAACAWGIAAAGVGMVIAIISR